MLVKPVVMNGMVQRSHDMSQIKQGEHIKGFVDQTNIQAAEQKANQVKHETVIKKDDVDKEQKKYDAKEKGNGEFFDNRKKKQDKKENEGKVILKNTSGFDVKI